MGGNCMVQKYLWNGQSSTILYTKIQYTNKHVMTIKILLASFMNEKITIDWYKYNCDILSLKSQDFKTL
jgi:hypothetical protein